jgi:hypothetical protein
MLWYQESSWLDHNENENQEKAHRLESSQHNGRPSPPNTTKFGITPNPSQTNEPHPEYNRTEEYEKNSKERKIPRNHRNGIDINGYQKTEFITRCGCWLKVVERRSAFPTLP